MCPVFRQVVHISLIDYSFLVILTLSFIYNLASIYWSSLDHIVQLDTFDDLTKDVINCYTNTHRHVNQNNNEKPTTRNGSSDPNTTQDIDPICPIDNERLRYFDDYELETWLHYNHVQLGGRFSPIGCIPKQSVAIVVPFRDRQENLDKFALYMHQFLPDQLIDYTLFVIEQVDESPFGKAKLYNIGASEIRRLRDDICCLIFHDVDLMPLDQRNLYMCTKEPRHLSSGVSNLRFQLPYPSFLGGVIAMTVHQYDSIGGFSNRLSGRKAESDLFDRIVANNHRIERGPSEYGIYLMQSHHRGSSSEKLKNSEGVSSELQREIPLEALYILENIESRPLYTKISVKFI